VLEYKQKEQELSCKEKALAMARDEKCSRQVPERDRLVAELYESWQRRMTFEEVGLICERGRCLKEKIANDSNREALEKLSMAQLSSLDLTSPALLQSHLRSL